MYERTYKIVKADIHSKRCIPRFTMLLPRFVLVVRKSEALLSEIYDNIQNTIAKSDTSCFFRAWDKETKTIMEATSLNFYDELVYLDETPMTGIRRKMGAVELMQYTGLKDKNGKEIYEGDLVKARGFEPELHIVRFDRGAFCLEPITGMEIHFWSDIKYVEDEHGEVIGNIYSNPELLTDVTSEEK